MPVIDSFARFTPSQRPGYGSFTLMHFDPVKALGDGYTNGISLLIKRSSSKDDEPLADFQGTDAQGFLTIRPTRCQKRGLDFLFDVGPEVVNPMAYDNSGDYILQLRGRFGGVLSFKVSLVGQPRASVQFGPQPTPRPSFKAGVNDKGAENHGPAGMPGPSGAPNAAGAGAAVAGQAQKVTQRDMAEKRELEEAERQRRVRSSAGLIKLFGILGVILVLGLLFFFFKDLILGPEKELTLADTAYEQEVAPEPESAPEVPAAPEPEPAAPVAAAEPEQVTRGLEIPESAAASVGAGAVVGGRAVGTTTTMMTAQQNCRLAGNKGDDRTIINNCLATQPTNADLQSLLAEAMRAERCEIALRILRTKGRSADGGIFAYVYALYADPKSTYNSPCITKSPEDARYWAERVRQDRSFSEAQGQELLEAMKVDTAQ